MFELTVFLILLLISIPLLGQYMAFVFRKNEPLTSIEAFIYRFCLIDPEEEMSWKEYAKALLWFNFLGFLCLVLIQITQYYLPLNPQQFDAPPFLLAINTAISYVTNTNWQSYSGETTLSYVTQAVGLTPQNFISAASGNAVLIALIRGIKRTEKNTLGNFWLDITKTILYILLPLSCVLALFLISQGVIQNISPYVHALTLENDIQTIPMGPVASQVAIAQLGSNGGGFFGANAAHPLTNPTLLSNFFECFALILIPASAVYMYGLMIGSKKESFTLLSVMFFLWFCGLALSWVTQTSENMTMPINPVMEGIETRFSSFETVLWSTLTTAISNGSVNSSFDSLSPLSGGVALFNIMVGELIFGGVGVGLCSMIMFVILTVFLSGLMVGRTPEYLNKKIGKTDIQWVMLSILSPCALILIGSGITAISPSDIQSLGNNGPHGLSEILYVFASTAGNNGSSFAGLNSNTPYYLTITSIMMLLGRLAILIPCLGLAGSLVTKKTSPPSLGSFLTAHPLFAALLVSVIIIVGALTFFPALSLGPIIEQFLMAKGVSF